MRKKDRKRKKERRRKREKRKRERKRDEERQRYIFSILFHLSRIPKKMFQMQFSNFFHFLKNCSDFYLFVLFLRFQNGSDFSRSASDLSTLFSVGIEKTSQQIQTKIFFCIENKRLLFTPSDNAR